MTEWFDPRSGPVVVPATITGPSGTIVVRLILDTGATSSFVSPKELRLIGLAEETSAQLIPVATGNGNILVPEQMLTRITCLGRTRIGMRVAAHRVVNDFNASGLLGLDFLRGGRLLIDFDAGSIGYQ